MAVDNVINVIVAGIGGQGVLRASDIFGQVVFAAGYDVKKSEVHGMSQRGGSVVSDIRFGKQVFSPMVPPEECDYLVVLEETQIESNVHRLRPNGVLIKPDSIDLTKLRNKRSINVALLGVLSTYLTDLPEELWLTAIRDNFAEKLHQVNETAFRLGKSSR